MDSRPVFLSPEVLAAGDVRSPIAVAADAARSAYRVEPTANRPGDFSSTALSKGIDV